jgi:hypothetical protein
LIKFLLYFKATLSSTQSINYDAYLTHYWPICNGQMLDMFGSADMSQGSLATFTTDRNGVQNSALAFNGGYTQVPNGFYFNSPQFTVTCWFYPQSIAPCSRIFDFGNGPGSDNIVVNLDSCASTNQPGISIFNGNVCFNSPMSPIALTNVQWQFLALTYDGANLKFYINNVLAIDAAYAYSPPTLVRANNYFGKSNWISDGFSSSYLDDVRFYNISLTQSQINDIMMLNYSCTNVPTPTTTTTAALSTNYISKRLYFFK